MKGAKSFVWGVTAFAAVQAAQGDTISEAPLPKVQLLSCGTQCADFTPAKVLEHQLPKHMEGPIVPSTRYSEGMAWLQYTIGTDGKVRDIVPIYWVGEKSFVDTAAATVAAWTFSPAVRTGKPVEQIQYMAETFPVLGMGLPGAQPDIAAAYRDAGEMFRAGKEDDAKAKLAEVLSRPRLTFFERSLVALPLARLAMKRQDYLEARRLALLATGPGTSVLPPNSAIELWEIRIKADLLLGEISDALTALENLKSVNGFDPSDPVVSMVNSAHSKFAALPQVTVQAGIPAANEGGIYWHDISRRTFAFQPTDGLDQFTLACRQSILKSKITPMAQWTVPKSWSECMIFVTGQPGTKFSVIEASDSAPSAPVAK